MGNDNLFLRCPVEGVSIRLRQEQGLMPTSKTRKERGFHHTAT